MEKKNGINYSINNNEMKIIKQKECQITDAKFNILSIQSLTNQINYRADLLLKEIFDKHIDNKTNDDLNFHKFKKTVRNNINKSKNESKTKTID